MPDFLRIRSSLSSKTLPPSTSIFSLMPAHVPRSFRIKLRRRRLSTFFLGAHSRSLWVVLARSGLFSLVVACWGVVTSITNDESFLHQTNNGHPLLSDGLYSNCKSCWMQTKNTRQINVSAPPGILCFTTF